MKYAISIVILLCWLSSAICLPAFIQNKTVHPTPEQIAEYQKKVIVSGWLFY